MRPRPGVCAAVPTPSFNAPGMLSSSRYLARCLIALAGPGRYLRSSPPGSTRGSIIPKQWIAGSSPAMTKELAGPGRAEAARAALAAGQLMAFRQGRMQHRRDHQLRDPRPALHHIGRVAEIDQDDLDLAAIIG